MINLIRKLGLRENEAKVYLALLELGPALVSDISQKAGLNRTTGYDILEKLVGYGLVSYTSGEESKKKYAAEAPDRLEDFFERKGRTFQNRLADFKERLNELQAVYKKADKPVIKFFEGTEGLKGTLDPGDITRGRRPEVLTIVDFDGWDVPDLVRFVKKYIKEVAKNKYPERALIIPTKKAMEWIKNYPPLVERQIRFRYIPRERFNLFGTELNIVENIVYIGLLENPNRMAVEINSRHLADTLRILFEMAWEAAEKYTPQDVLQTNRKKEKKLITYSSEK